MSLISDALKEAQRERSERAGAPDRKNASPPDAFFPAPAKRAPKRSIAFFVAGIGAVVVLALVTIIVLRSRSNADRSAPLKTSQLLSTPIATAPTRDSLPRIANSGAGPAKTTRPPPLAGEIGSSVAPHVAAEAHPGALPAAAIARDSVGPRESTMSVVSAQTSSPAPLGAAPPRAPSPVQSSPTPGVRVVLDPSGTHPADSLFAQAYAEQLRGNSDRAADLYEKALQIKPVSPQLYNDYGALLAARGNHTAAIAMYGLGLKGDDKEPRLWINLGDSYKAIGRHADAMSTYAEAAKLDPSNAGLKVRLAAEYAAIGDSSSARRGYEEASRAAPTDAAVHHAVGVYLQSQRDYRGAIREFQLFVDLAPGKYPAETIDAVRVHIVRLAKLSP